MGLIHKNVLKTRYKEKKIYKMKDGRYYCDGVYYRLLKINME